MKQFTALLLACVLLVSLAACGGGSTAGSASASSGSAAASPGGAADSVGDQADTSPVTFTIFIDHSWYPSETFAGIIPEEITRLTGVTLDPTVAMDQQQLGVMIGSGELPDLVYTQNLIDQMSDSALSYSYEELISEYNVDWDIPAKQLGIARGFSADGKAYTVLNHYSEKADWVDSNSVPMLGSLAYRKDIWEALGSPDMKSFDDLMNVFATVKEQYPDMVPLKLNENWNTLSLRFLKGLGQLDFIEQDDGSYIHYSRDSRNKELLRWINECFRKGYMIADESYFVTGSNAAPTGTYFASCVCTQNGIPGTNAELKLMDPSYVLAELVPFAESDYKTSDLGWSATFITKGNSNPERAIRFMQWMFTPEAQALTQMGREGIEYTLDDKGFPVFSDDWVKSIEEGNQITVYNTWFYLGGSETVEADSRVATLDPALVADAYKVIRERFDNYPWVNAALPIGSSDEKVILDKIKELYAQNYEKRIIMAASEAEFEAMYDEYLSNAEKTGIAQLEEYMTNRIAEVMPLYQ